MNDYSSITPSYMAGFHTEVLKNRVFGAFMVAIEYRKDTASLTQKALAEGMGKDETNVSKLLAGPRNWQLSTIASLASALNLDFEFALVDRSNKVCVFMDTGMYDRRYGLPVNMIFGGNNAVGHGGINFILNYPMAIGLKKVDSRSDQHVNQHIIPSGTSA